MVPAPGNREGTPDGGCEATEELTRLLFIYAKLHPDIAYVQARHPHALCSVSQENWLRKHALFGTLGTALC